MSSSSNPNISSPVELMEGLGNKGTTSEHTFTVVSYSKKKATSARTRPDTYKGASNSAGNSSTTTRASSAKVTEDKDEQFITMSSFASFQAKFFPILSYLVGNIEDPNDAFLKCWQTVQSGRNAVMANSSFRTITKAYNIQDLQQFGQL
jgi:hypothetical protein